MRRRWPRRILVGVNVVVALALVGAAGGYAYVHYQLNRINKVAVTGLHSAAGPFTLLIVGSDTRNLKGPGNAEYGGASATPGQRSDTIMLARVVPAERKITLMSIPRDLYVPIKGIGDSRINSAFDNGPNLLVSTIQHDLGIPINHFVEVNFDTFKSITDAVGGVKFYFPTPVRDAYSNLSVPKAGCVNLTGNQALGFARSRHYEYEVNGQWLQQGLSDIARIQRQQAFVKKMIKKAETKFTDPIALNGIIDSITKNLTVDKGFGAGTMVNLAADFRTANVAGIPTETLPTNPAVIGGADVLTLQQGAAKTMITKFNDLGTSKAVKAKPKAPTPDTTVPGSHVAVEVANGSGKSGQAARAGSGLGRLGYKVTVNPQSAGQFKASTIEYAPDAAAAAKQLSLQVGGSVTLTESAALTPTPYSLKLITGTAYTGVGAKMHAKPASKSKAAASTTTTTYLLPGPSPTKSELASC